MEARLARPRSACARSTQALDDNMGQLNGLSSYVTQQMRALTSSASTRLTRARFVTAQRRHFARISGLKGGTAGGR